MASWYRFTVTPSAECARLHAAMLEYSSQDDVRFQMKRDVAVFCRTLATEEYFQFYFTPAAAKVFDALIKKHAGVPCGPPPIQIDFRRGDLALLLGSTGALDFTRETYLQLVAEVRGEA